MRISDYYRSSLTLCAGFWLLACAINALAGGPLGGEPFTLFMGRVGSNLTNIALLTDVLLFFFAQFLCVLVWAALVAWGAMGIAHVRQNLKAQTTVRWSFGLSLAMLITINSVLYPLSIYALPFSSAFLGHLSIGIFAFFFTVIIVFAFVREKHVQLSGGIPAVGLAVFIFISGVDDTSPLSFKATEKPNIIVIGIDALRPDITGFFGYQPSPTPNLDSLLKHASVYENTYTPVARTYAAWMSMLSGQYPITHGARFNLMAEEYVDKDALITKKIKQNGYSTIWALDERHFNHIDHGYGFDKVVGPKIGAADLVVTVFADNPIVNIVSNTRIGKTLFPFVAQNRANYVTYNPYLFNDEVIAAVASFQRPVFLAVHFCLPHFPFISNLMPEVSDEMAHGIDEGNYRQYLSMVNLVDRQLADLINNLSENGTLDNAVVYLLSDHGEGLSLDRDVFESGVKGADFEMNLPGHGNSVLTPSQFRVLLAKMRFRNGRPVSSGNVDSSLRSLVDLAPDVMQTLSLGADLPFEGVPLDEANKDRTIYMESSFSTAAMKEERIDVLRAISEAVDFYAVNDEGETYLIPEAYDELLEAKQRAAVSGDTLVAIYPDEVDNVLVLDLKKKRWWPSSVLDKMEEEAQWKPVLQDLCDAFSDDHFLDHGFCDSGADR